MCMGRWWRVCCAADADHSPAIAEAAAIRSLVTSDCKQAQCLCGSCSLNEVQFDCLFGGWDQSIGAAWFDDLELIELSPGR